MIVITMTLSHCSDRKDKPFLYTNLVSNRGTECPLDFLADSFPFIESSMSSQHKRSDIALDIQHFYRPPKASSYSLCRHVNGVDKKSHNAHCSQEENALRRVYN
ncbi:hypothetical protein TNCT_371071 [Trichonephila clavata]|uniref:Uncharacterized protein n=1 Tax=Trichonephila clavata TaxID=2740835 RepID=A0A8X6G3H9_TRICU|nr:hypothetical protein TNCT_371071 [Trichonephila clavata]